MLYLCSNNRNMRIIVSSIIAVAFSILTVSCINEEYSFKNFDNSASLLPDVRTEADTDINFEVSIKQLLMNGDAYQEPFQDSEGDFWIVLQSVSDGTEATHTLNGEDVSPYGGECYLYDATLSYNLSYSFLEPLYENGSKPHTPIYVKFENPDALEGSVTIELQAGSSAKNAVYFSGLSLKPGQNEYILDSEEMMSLMSDYYLSTQRLFFYFTPEEGTVVPQKSYTIKVSARISVGIMPGESYSFQYGSSLLSELGFSFEKDIFSLSLESRVENSIPADLVLSVSNSTGHEQYMEEYMFKGSITGLKNIPAGSVPVPGVTDMSVNISGTNGINKIIPFMFGVSVPGDRPVRLNAGQKISVNISNVKLQK